MIMFSLKCLITLILLTLYGTFSICKCEHQHGDGQLHVATQSLAKLNVARQTTPSITVSPPTLSPATFANYTLDISSSGPVVLDSTIVFRAVLKDAQGHLAQRKLFRYLWSNSADTEMKTTIDDFNASIESKFFSNKVVPGQYLMTVVVYMRNTQPRTIVAYSSTQFELTAYLNGNLKLQQQLLYQRNNRTFSSGKVITIHANMTDKFSTKPFSSKVDFEYFWYKNTTLLKVTKEPFYKFMSSDSGNLTLSTLVIATLRPDRASRRDTALFQTNRLCESRKPSRLSQFNRLERERNASKCGLLEQSVIVKDSLRFVMIYGGTNGPVGGSVKMNVTCDGSASSYPTSLCWNVTDTNFSLPIGTASCDPWAFVDSCQHSVEIQLNSTGWHIVWFTTYNDVSFITSKHFVYAYEPASNSSPLLLIPVVFSVLGVVIVLLGVGYILRLRKKPWVEVADFDFHPSLSSENSLLIRARSAWGKARSWSGLPRYESPRNKRYGSMNINETL